MLAKEYEEKSDSDILSIQVFSYYTMSTDFTRSKVMPDVIF
jgi:hypothetical protein